MATVMTPEDFAREHGANLASLKTSIEEARNDSITKASMNQNTLTARNITPETERFMKDFLGKAGAAGL